MKPLSPQASRDRVPAIQLPTAGICVAVESKADGIQAFGVIYTSMNVQAVRDFQAFRYINAIRNLAKKTYAQDYWRWLNTTRAEPSPVYQCSYMAAQAVRLTLQDIIEPQVQDAITQLG